jgi:hypothetical protein
MIKQVVASLLALTSLGALWYWLSREREPRQSPHRRHHRQPTAAQDAALLPPSASPPRRQRSRSASARRGVRSEPSTVKPATARADTEVFVQLLHLYAEEGTPGRSGKERHSRTVCRTHCACALNAGARRVTGSRGPWRAENSVVGLGIFTDSHRQLR